MPLPILTSRNEPSPRDLVRLFHQSESRWVQHMAEGEDLDVGTAYTCPALPNVYDANHIRDAVLPEGMTPAQAVQIVEAHFAARGTRCAYWVPNPSAPPERTRVLVDHLLASGYAQNDADILLLGRIPKVIVPPVPESLRIIPSRASFRHARELALEASERFNEPSLADAHMTHLDDPHWDSLLALEAGRPAATIGVLAFGEVGRIDDVYVARAHRGRGLGTLMMARAMEICARSLFKHVMLAVLPTNAPAHRLYAKFGFKKLSTMSSYNVGGVRINP